VAELQIDSNFSQSSAVDDAAKDAGMAWSLQIVSANDAEFDNLLRGAVALGNSQLLSVCVSMLFQLSTALCQ